MKMEKVLLLNMPFISLSRPAIGISLLKARLAEEGLACDIAYPNLSFADRVGKDAYELISDHLSPAFFAGDWLFAQHLFSDRLDLATYEASLRQHLKEEGRFEMLMGMRSAIQPYLDECLEEFRILEYRIIGFTTSFEQNMASLALAHTMLEMNRREIYVSDGVMRLYKVARKWEQEGRGPWLTLKNKLREEWTVWVLEKGRNPQTWSRQ